MPEGIMSSSKVSGAVWARESCGSQIKHSRRERKEEEA
jgi:hypothetical protein